MSAASLRLSEVACVRGGRMLFAGLDLTLDAGGAAIVGGPNGIGKSSLLRLCAGLLQPFSGRVERLGGVALLAEDHALDPECALGKALGFWAGIDGGRDRQAAAIERVGLGGLEPVPVRFLSTGQRKRAGLARMIASGAGLWLLDEPANGLDSEGVAMLEALIAEHRAAGGVALVASHSPIALADARQVRLERPA